MVLKRLDKAIEDNDHIYAVIRGTAINENGRTDSITMPGPEAQEELMRFAYNRFGVNMAEVSYVEAHATGTAVGDPLEANAIGRSIGAANKTKLRIGSVKSNIGHLECAAGMASMVKVALMLGTSFLSFASFFSFYLLSFFSHRMHW
jgi:acyl transferase domain-containing protein